MISKLHRSVIATALFASVIALGSSPANATATLNVTPDDGVTPGLTSSTNLVISLTNLPADATSFVFNVSGVVSAGYGNKTTATYTGGVFTKCAFGEIAFKPASTTTAACTSSESQYTFTPSSAGGAGTSLEVEVGYTGYKSEGPYTVEAIYTSGGSPVTQTVTLTEKASASATVTFDANGGSGTAMTNQIASTATNLTKNTYTRSGYAFTGWATSPTGAVAYVDEASYPFTTSATLYAIWEAQGAAITDFSAVAGGPINTVESNGSPITFKGTTETSGVKGIVIATQIGNTGFPSSSLGACPSWVEYVELKTPDNSFQVNCYASGSKLRLFRADGNTLPAGTQFTVRIASQTITFSAGITMSLYTTAGMQFDDVAIDTASTTIVWPQTVKFLADGGTGTMDDQLSVGAANLDPNEFSNNGFNFAGWIDYANGGKVYADEAEYPFINTSTGVTNLTAKWEAAAPSSFTVSFNANGGIGSMVDQSASSATPLTSNTFTRSGYTFAGWNTNSDGSGISYSNGANYPFTASTTLYAQWTADSVVPTTTATVSLGVPIGGFIPGSTTAITAQGLQASAPFDVVLRSTPQTLASGAAISGAVNTTVTMPTGIEPGWHSITFSSTAADGTAFSQVLYFLVSDSSTLVATSATAPNQLVSTGSSSPVSLGNAALLLLTGAGLIGLSLARRSKLRVR